ncbi:MAG: hypothetical protein KAX05_16870 [Bacteroidales bacterium]|nr:hypothetical protein [Bacteroidales bacterium]
MEKKYLQGIPISKIAKEYGVAYHSLYEHCQSHISRQLIQSCKKQDAIQSMDLMGEFARLIADIKNMIDQFKDKKQHGLTLKAVDTLIRLYSTMAQFASVFYQVQADDHANNRAVIEQEIKEQQQEEIGQYLDNLNEIERAIYVQLNLKMIQPDHEFLSMDGTFEVVMEKIRSCFPYDFHFPDEEMINGEWVKRKIPDDKLPEEEEVQPFKRTRFNKDIDVQPEEDRPVQPSKHSDKTEIESEQEPEDTPMTIKEIKPTEIPGGEGGLKLRRHLLGRSIQSGRTVDESGVTGIPFSGREQDNPFGEREYADE